MIYNSTMKTPAISLIVYQCSYNQDSYLTAARTRLKTYSEHKLFVGLALAARIA
jgi:hypothetical protein